MEQIAVFVLGLIFGSFANVIVFRLNTGESLIFGGSRCFYCGRNLRWFELIPVVSFLALRGKCRSCGSKISWQYPAVELASGALFLLLWSEPGSYQLGKSPALTITAVLFFWLLLVISVYDIRHKIIPNPLVYFAILTAVLFLGFVNWNLMDNLKLIIENLAAGFGLFLFFGVLWFVSGGRWMGFGYAKLALALGIMLGWPLSLAAFFMSFWLGALLGLLYKFSNRSAGFKTQMPFAPFLSAGGLVAYLWGEKIIFWYLSLL